MINIPVLLAAFSILQVWIPSFPDEPSVMYAYFTTVIAAVFLHAMTRRPSGAGYVAWKAIKAVRTTFGLFGKEHVNLAGKSRTIEPHYNNLSNL